MAHNAHCWSGVWSLVILLWTGHLDYHLQKNNQSWVKILGPGGIPPYRDLHWGMLVLTENIWRCRNLLWPDAGEWKILLSMEASSEISPGCRQVRLFTAISLSYFCKYWSHLTPVQQPVLIHFLDDSLMYITISHRDKAPLLFRGL